MWSRRVWGEHALVESRWCEGCCLKDFVCLSSGLGVTDDRDHLRFLSTSLTTYFTILSCSTETQAVLWYYSSVSVYADSMLWHLYFCYNVSEMLKNKEQSKKKKKKKYEWLIVHLPEWRQYSHQKLANHSTAVNQDVSSWNQLPLINQSESEITR